MKKILIFVGFIVISSVLLFSQRIDLVNDCGGGAFRAGSPLNIGWNSHGCANWAKITLLKGGSPIKVIAERIPNRDGWNELDWIIPKTVSIPTGSDYKIMIQTSGRGPSCTDQSNTYFSIAQLNIIVLEPNGGETWLCGQGYQIKWTSSYGSDNKVKIALLKGGNVLTPYLASNVNNSGSLPNTKSITLPSNLQPGSNYKIRVSEMDDGIYGDSERNFTIKRERSGPDLTISQLSLQYASLVVNQYFWAKTWVKNIGAGTSPPTKLLFKIGGSAHFFDIPSLAPGQTHGPLSRTSSFTTAGSFGITATADSNNDANESNENNNTKQTMINVTAPEKPDLFIAGISWSPPGVGQYIHITVTVKNRLNCGMAPATKLRFKIGGETNPPLYNIPPLAPGQNHSIGRGFTPSRAGNYIITATADAENDVVEKNENDNTRQTKLEVK